MWRQSFLRGRASRVDQLTGNISSRGQFARLKSQNRILASVLVTDYVRYVSLSGAILRMNGTIPSLTYLLIYLKAIQKSLESVFSL